MVSDDWHSLKKVRKVHISLRVCAPRSIRKKGETWLTYEEQLKRIEMMARKNNDRINERINDDIDHDIWAII